MKRAVDLLKIALLLTVLLVLGWSALPGTAQADVQAQVTCEGEGHTCHASIGGTLYHLEKLPPSY